MKKKIIAISLAVALISILAAPMAAYAANPGTGTTQVSGDIGTVYTITPGAASLALGPFAAAQAYASSDMTISVSTNDGTKNTVTIVVSDSKATTKGYLTLGGFDDAAKKLANPLYVKGGAVNSYASLASDQTLRNSAAFGSAAIADFSVQQTIDSGDLSKTAGSYNLSLTFTATFN